MIQLTENANEEVRRDMFERINTGSVELNDMEKRIGGMPGSFLDLIQELSKNSKFRDLCSFNETAINRREPQEFVLRFFAFLNNYEKFNPSQVNINTFLDNYLKNVNNDETIDREKMRNEFESVLYFVEQYFSKGFRQGKKYDKTTTRIKFESLSVGIALALRERNDIKAKSTDLITSEKFKELTGGDTSSSKVKVIKRIEYVRDQVLCES